MAYTDVCSDVVTAIVTHAKDNALAYGWADVVEGDTGIVGNTPLLCVMAGTTEKTLVGSPYRVDNLFEVVLMSYWDEVFGTTQEELERESLKKMEAFDRGLQADMSLGGVILYGFIIRHEPGYARVAGRNKWMRTIRSTFQAHTRTNLGGVS